MRDHTLFINSNSRLTDSSIHNAFYKLDPSLFIFDEEYELHFHLISFNAKIYYDYLESDRNTIFTYTENSVNHTITIPDGTYNAKELATAIETELNAASSFTWSVVYTLSTNKFTFTRNVDTYNCSFSFDSAYSTHEILGFGVSEVSSFTSGILEKISTNYISIGNEAALAICVDWHRDSEVAHSENDSSGNKSNVLCYLPLNIPRFGSLFYDTPGTATEHTYGFRVDRPRGSNVLNIQLKSPAGAYLKLLSDYIIVFRLSYEPKIPRENLTNHYLKQILNYFIQQSQTKAIKK